MVRTAVGAVVLATVLVAALAQERQKARCNPAQFSGRCYWTRGRLRAYNGPPAIRLWRIGTKQVLGISSGPDANSFDPLDNEHPRMPPEVTYEFKPPFAADLFGDFEVCPLEPYKPGSMQSACIAEAKNLAVRDRH